MKLLTLLIANFRGIVSLLIDAQGKNVNIYGANGKGKTSTEDAFLWLLFGKDSADKKDYDLIPHRAGLTEPDIGCGKEPVVEASLEYFGKTVKLKKSYIEEWPKKGELKGQYAGSKTHFFVDDLEVKAGEYQNVVSELVDPDLFKLITNPHYFSETLSWQERRATLVKITGELSVSLAPELAALMENRPFDNFFALAKQNVKSTQKQLDGLPYAITEARRMIPTELPKMPDIAALTASRDELESQLQTLKNDDSANAVRREIAEIETQIAEARNKYAASVDVENKKINDGIRLLEDLRREKNNALSDAQACVKRAETEINRLTELKFRKLDEWHVADNSQWQGAEICPTCGQQIPADQIETARAAFNMQRSQSLEKIKNDGVHINIDIAEVSQSKEQKSTEIDKLDSEITVLDQRIGKGKSMVKPCIFETQIIYKQLSGRVVDLKKQLEKGTDTDKQSRVDTLTAQISELYQHIESANRIKLQIEQAAEQQKHVDELMAQDKTLNAELGKWEKAVSLCEQHVKNQAKALETAVNGKFKIARFEMFEMQKNGEEAECCKVVYPNGSTNLSTGERLQTGVDIISTLSEYYGVNAPIWIDNAEGVTLPVETQAQIIRLNVTAEDKLRVEVEA